MTEIIKDGRTYDSVTLIPIRKAPWPTIERLKELEALEPTAEELLKRGRNLRVKFNPKGLRRYSRMKVS